MSTFYHGVKTTLKSSGAISVVEADSGIPVAIGTAPVQQVDSTDDIVLAYSYDDAVEALGYSDNWEKYTLCEVIYNQFKNYGVGPVLFINVADPDTDCTEVEATEMAVVSGQVLLPEDAIASSVSVVDASSNQLTAGTDYETYYSDGYLVVAVTSTGSAADATTLTIGYKKMDFTLSGKKDDVIGGYDTRTGKSSGLELVDDCYAKLGINPDIIIAPGFSSDPEVATVMNTKTTMATLFHGKAIIDVDCTDSGAIKYTDVNTWKSANNIYDENEILCWPMLKNGEKIYHLSTQLAALMAQTDANNSNVPSESPSNKSLSATAMCLADGTEITVNLEKANYLNSIGVVTGLNFIGGLRAWGNYTSCYPSDTAPEDCFIPANRTKDWLRNTLILTFWQKVDGKLTRRLAESITETCNHWLNGLVSAEHMYGGRVELLESENTDEDIMAGRVRPHVYYCPVNPAQEIDFVCEYDSSYLSDALTA